MPTIVHKQFFSENDIKPSQTYRDPNFASNLPILLQTNQRIFEDTPKHSRDFESLATPKNSRDYESSFNPYGQVYIEDANRFNERAETYVPSSNYIPTRPSINEKEPFYREEPNYKELYEDLIRKSSSFIQEPKRQTFNEMSVSPTSTFDKEKEFYKEKLFNLLNENEKKKIDSIGMKDNYPYRDSIGKVFERKNYLPLEEMPINKIDEPRRTNRMIPEFKNDEIYAEYKESQPIRYVPKTNYPSIDRYRQYFRNSYE
jgi:hypothetical protein